MMEWISSLPDLLSLLFGGSVISIVTWRFARKKANAEAQKAEAEANQAKQDYYQEMLADVARDRDYYKQERDDMRATIKRYDERMDELDRKVSRNGRMVEAMRPFMCGDMNCKMRQRVVVSADGEVRKPRQKKLHEIEPNNED